MLIPNEAESNGKYFSSGDNEGNKMLLKLLDHTVYEHLSDCTADGIDKQIQGETPVLQKKLANVPNL